MGWPQFGVVQVVFIQLKFEFKSICYVDINDQNSATTPFTGGFYPSKNSRNMLLFKLKWTYIYINIYIFYFFWRFLVKTLFSNNNWTLPPKAQKCVFVLFYSWYTNDYVALKVCIICTICPYFSTLLFPCILSYYLDGDLYHTISRDALIRVSAKQHTRLPLISWR